MTHRDITLIRLSQRAHSTDALDLATRAADYITLEVGHAPDAAFIRSFFTAAPPDLGPECLLHLGIMEGPAMVGMLCIAQGYEYPADWWIGLMILDPAFRGQRIGHRVIGLVKDRAKEHGVDMIKLAVLSANPRGLKFWQREGFVHHRDAPATPQSDGHDRVVLKYIV